MDGMRVKVFKGDDIRRCRIPEKANWGDFENTVRGLFNISPRGRVRLQYKDSDNDLITMSSTMELNEAIADAKRRGLADLRVYVHETGADPANPTGSVSTEPALATNTRADNDDTNSFAATSDARTYVENTPTQLDHVPAPETATPPAAATDGTNASDNAQQPRGPTASGPWTPERGPDLHNFVRDFMPHLMERASRFAEHMANQYNATHPPGAPPHPGYNGTTNSGTRTFGAQQSHPPPQEPTTATRATPGVGQSEERYAHWGVECGHCHSVVVGRRYRCAQCTNYDLCEDCHAELGATETSPPHNPTHTFTHIPHPMSFFQPEASAAAQQFAESVPHMVDWFCSTFAHPSGASAQGPRPPAP